MSNRTRRAFLRTGIVAASPLVAGCSSSTGEDSGALTTFDDTETSTETESERTAPYVEEPNDVVFNLVNPRSDPLEFAFVRFPYSGFNYSFYGPPQRSTKQSIDYETDETGLVESEMEIRRYKYASGDIQPETSGDVTATFESFSMDQDTEDVPRRFVITVPNPTDIPSNEIERVQYRTRPEFSSGSPPRWADDGIRFRGVTDGDLELDVELLGGYPYWVALHRSPAQLRVESLSSSAEFTVEFPRPSFDIENVRVSTNEGENGLELDEVSLTISAQSPVPTRIVRAYLIQRRGLVNSSLGKLVADVGFSDDPNLHPGIVPAEAHITDGPSVISPVTGQERIGQTREVTLTGAGKVLTPLPEDTSMQIILTRYDTILGSTEFDLKPRL